MWVGYATWYVCSSVAETVMDLPRPLELPVQRSEKNLNQSEGVINYLFQKRDYVIPEHTGALRMFNWPFSWSKPMSLHPFLTRTASASFFYTFKMAVMHTVHAIQLYNLFILNEESHKMDLFLEDL
jgi:hypothetical protein